MDIARADAVRECSDVGGRRAAILPIEIDDDASHRRARTRTISRIEPRPLWSLAYKERAPTEA